MRHCSDSDPLACGLSMTGTVEWNGCAVAKSVLEQTGDRESSLGGILASNRPCATSLRNFGNSVYTTLTCQCLLEEMLAQSEDRPAGAIYGSLVRAGIHVSCKACLHDLCPMACSCREMTIIRHVRFVPG